MINEKRKKGERFETFLRRFNKRVIRSGKIMSARDKRFHHRKENKNKIQDRALKKIAFREKITYLRKTGQWKEEPRRRSN